MRAWIPLLLTILMPPLKAKPAPTGPIIADAPIHYVSDSAHQWSRGGVYIAATAAVQYVSPNGDDANDGLSWSTAKLNIETAETSLPPCSFGSHCGTVYVGPGTYTLTSELDIGDSSGSPVVVKLTGPTTVNMEVSGSSSCSIEQWPNSVLEGVAKGGGGLAGRILFEAFAGFSPYAFYCTVGALTGQRGFYSASGFMIHNLAGATTTSGYAAVFAAVLDGSRFSEINITDATNNGAWVWAACCGTTFLNDVIGAKQTGGVALTVGPGLEAPGRDQDMDVNFIGMSVAHSNPSSSVIVIQEPKNDGGNLNFYGTYIEGDLTAHTVPFIDIKAAEYGVHWHGLQIEALTQETVYAMYIEKGAQVCVSVSGLIFVGHGDRNAIKNAKNGQTVVANTLIPNYTYLDNKYNGGIVAHLGAGGISAGTITLSSGSGSYTFSRPYPDTPVCTATDSTSASPVQVTSTPTSIAVTGTGSDKVEWLCVARAK